MVGCDTLNVVILVRVQARQPAFAKATAWSVRWKRYVEVLTEAAKPGSR